MLPAKDFDYHLPKTLIAQYPASPRDQSRLLVLDRRTGKIKHECFYNIVDYLRQGDVLVLNNTKVMRARLIGKKAGTGGKMEVFLLNPHPPASPGASQGGQPLSHFRSFAGRRGKSEVWQCLIGGQGRKENLKINFQSGLKAEILKNNHDGTWNVKFNKNGAVFLKIVEKIGQVPLPPYIKQKNKKTRKQESKDYQTVYADENKIGSVAAPTAGLHFTKKLLQQLKKKGVQIEFVTLRVGLGTFAPVKEDDITKHKMHSEWAEANSETIARLCLAKQAGRRIIAVGTTSVRVLESAFSSNVILERSASAAIESNSKKCERDPIGRSFLTPSRMTNYSFWTDIFIYPGYKFKIVDALITNFHLPKSTLIMLVAALAGKNKIFKAYRAAIKKKYRFFSYGDAMLII